MAGQVVELSSDSSGDEGPYRPLAQKHVHEISLLSDDEFPDIDFGGPLGGACTRITNSIPVHQATVNGRVFGNDRIGTAVEETFTHLRQKPVEKAFTHLIQRPVEKTAPTSLKPAKKSKTDKTEKALKTAYEKAVKAAETANKKYNNAANCFKQLKVCIDSQLFDALPGSGHILNELESCGVKHSIAPSSFPKSICWTRKQCEYYVEKDFSVACRSSSIEEEDGVVVLPAREMAEMTPLGLHNWVEDALRRLGKQNLVLIIYGSNLLFREQELKTKKQVRERCTGSSQSDGNRNVNIWDRSRLEEFKVQLMLRGQSSVWPVECTEDLAKTVSHLTKAIAQRPWKQDRFEQAFDFYAGETGGGVRVSKEGQGLTRLWQQQIQQFPLAALETSQAIVSKYPTPQSLVKAYESCHAAEASLLLQDIAVRRNAGPLSTTRRVGPELSKRIHTFFTTTDGATVL